MKGVFSFDFPLIGDTIMYVIIFGAGVVIGIILIAKLIERLMLTRKTMIYGFIVGLLIASPLAILVNLFREYPAKVDEASFAVWLLSIMLVILGGLGSFYLGKKEHPEAIEELHEQS